MVFGVVASQEVLAINNHLLEEFDRLPNAACRDVAVGKDAASLDGVGMVVARSALAVGHDPFHQWKGV
jgi:hypothetical protein